MKVTSTGAERVGYDDSALVDMKDGDRFRPLGEGVATVDGAMLGDAEGENEGGD